MSNAKKGLPQWMEKYKSDDDLFQTLALLESEHEVRRFLYAIVTADERSMLANRWRVVMLIYEGYTVSQIYELTGIAKGTISEVKKWVVNVRKADEVCRIFYKRHRDFRINQSND